MTATAQGVFIDANVFLYAVDANEPIRQPIARALLLELRRVSRPHVSTQVLGEFCSKAVRKLKLPPDVVARELEYLRTYHVLTVDATLIGDALDVQRENRLSFWDALIITAAVAAGCDTVYTEDLNHNQVVRGVRIFNPFPHRAP